MGDLAYEIVRTALLFFEYSNKSSYLYSAYLVAFSRRYRNFM